MLIADLRTSSLYVVQNSILRATTNLNAHSTCKCTLYRKRRSREKRKMRCDIMSIRMLLLSLLYVLNALAGRTVTTCFAVIPPGIVSSREMRVGCNFGIGFVFCFRFHEKRGVGCGAYTNYTVISISHSNSRGTS
jgi:hypothetical protein